MLINEISPSTPEKFPLNPANKKSDQLKTSQPLIIAANKEQKPTKKEAILLVKIKYLESQLAEFQAENKKLRIGKEQAEELAQQEKQRADNLEIKLKTVARFLYQWLLSTIRTGTNITDRTIASP